MHDDLDQRLPIDELSPNTKLMYDLRSPKGKRNYEKGLIDGLRIANQRQRQAERQHVTECDDTSTPSCSTAIDTHVKRPRRQLQFAAGTIGVINKECNSAKDTASDNLCSLCNYEATQHEGKDSFMGSVQLVQEMVSFAVLADEKKGTRRSMAMR